MACYVFNQKIYQDKKKLMNELQDDSIVYKFNNYFEATYFVGQENKDKFKSKIIAVKYLKELLIPTKQKIEEQKTKNINFKSDQNILKVYTDGSSFNNGAKDISKRKGGIGVFFKDNDPRNLSLKLTKEIYKKTSNNVCELLACCYAIEIILASQLIGSKIIYIHTDSNYVINSIRYFPVILFFNIRKCFNLSFKSIYNR